MTTSDIDAEALSAIRIANQLIKKNGATWELIVGQFPPPSKQRIDKPEPAWQAKKKEETTYTVEVDDFEEMISYIRLHAWSEFDMSFVDSISDSYEKFGQLTWKQVKGLRNVYETVKDNFTEGQL